ncbi:MAG TPA: alginate lyase family protein [Pelobium sp.]|nr:alginate lyase family protein [Pelobium sp.]
MNKLKFSKKSYAILCFILMIATAVSGQEPYLFTLNPNVLSKNKIAFQQKDAAIIKKVEIVTKKADSYLGLLPLTVMQKSFTPSSGSKHDYMSLGPYWWPNPAKPDGLPYIRKDGLRNPEIKKITDRQYLGELEQRCKFLALAYYFTGDEKYATQARTFLNAWFINPETKMNPNLNYGQAIPGLNEGRGIGIIESRLMVDILDWVGLLTPSEGFKSNELPKLKSWFNDYLTWLLTSKNGLDEAQSKNNHGTFYELQVATFAAFVNNDEALNDAFIRLNSRMAEQFQPNGQQPLELERTNALSYSVMNLNGWFALAMLADKFNQDLFHKTTPEGGGLQKSLDWLIPYVFNEQEFKFQQIGNFDKNDFYPLLLIANQQYSEPIYQRYIKKYTPDEPNMVMDLLYKLPN